MNRPPTVTAQVGQNGHPYVEVTPDGDAVVAQAKDLLAWLRANQRATERILEAVHYRTGTDAAAAVLAAWLLDATTVQLGVDDADALADALRDAAHPTHLARKGA
ncbi:hypothetical protein [Ornithinimicrobium cerasi]|uniref:hypothetical protein n=1 Tax=Ornithinimicrobium cerasi TaxID=2248773 RepID=UPI000F00C4C6|nr:hypothetical protein [Ornithinimicrobium cerasi]